MGSDDHLYETVADEISAGQLDRVTWTRAFAHSGGGQDATKSLYIRYRVEQLRSELEQAHAAAREQQRVAAQHVKTGVLSGQPVTCPHCGHRGPAKLVPRGSLLV